MEIILYIAMAALLGVTFIFGFLVGALVGSRA